MRKQALWMQCWLILNLFEIFLEFNAPIAEFCIAASSSNVIIDFFHLAVYTANEIYKSIFVIRHSELINLRIFSSSSTSDSLETSKDIASESRGVVVA